MKQINQKRNAPLFRPGAFLNQKDEDNKPGRHYEFLALAPRRAPPVGIERLDLDSLANSQALPAPEVLDPLAAFHLDIGDKAAAYSVQLAIPVSLSGSLTPGEEIYFLRRGTVFAPEGTPGRDANGEIATWWLVDNGFVGEDGMARTASPPLPGIDCSGDYLVVKKIEGLVDGILEVSAAPGVWLTFGSRIPASSRLVSPCPCEHGQSPPLHRLTPWNSRRNFSD